LIEISVATLNVGGLGRPRPPLIPLERRGPELCRRLESARVDVLNLQEVFRYRQLRALRRHLPSYPAVAYQPGPIGPAGGLVTLSRFPLGPVRYRSFAGIVPMRGRLRFRVRRALLSAVQGMTQVGVAGHPVTIVNTHLTANRDGDWSPGNRFFAFQRAQLRRFNATLARWRRPGLTVITGDFNIASDSAHYPQITDHGARHDPFTVSDPVTFQAAFLPPGEPAHRIDYILLAGEASVLDAATLLSDPETVDGAPLYLSDHIGLTVHIGVTPHPVQ
jgi:endonuclease/exonuclease/phosphatase family metal-dependent hydrolase